jgi:hypothetical protein
MAVHCGSPTVFSNGKDLEMRLFGLRFLMAWVKPFAVVGLGIIWLATPGAAKSMLWPVSTSMRQTA